MVDLSKHLARAKQALERRNYDLVIEITEECQEVDPLNLDVYKLMFDAAKRRAKESGKKSMLATMSMPTFSKDPHKQLTAAVKRAANNPDVKTLAAAGDAARNVFKTGAKGAADVGIFLYEEMRSSGLFNADVLWNLANLYCDRFKETKENDSLEKALKTMAELERAVPNHAEAGRTIKNWEALRSMTKRQGAATGGGTSAAGADFRNQLSSDDKARRQEAMNRIIRTQEDAEEVMRYVDQDLKETPNDKALWLKKGDIHRRINQFAEARAAYEKAQAIDQYDFLVAMRMSDLNTAELQSRIATAVAAGEDAAPLKAELLAFEIDEYKRRIDRQPTDMTHRFNLAMRYIQGGNIDGAAAELQRTVSDPKLKKPSHRYLGYCMAKKKLLDLAVKQYTSYLSLTEDDLGEEAKEVRYARGRVLEDLKRKDEALADYSRLAEIDLSFKDVSKRLDNLTGGDGSSPTPN